MFLGIRLRKISIRTTTTWSQRSCFIAEENTNTGSLGIILTMMHFKKMRDEEGRGDIALAAGLPDASVPKEVKDELAKMSSMHMSPYLKYDQSSEYHVEKLAHKIAAFHNKQFGVRFTANQIGFSSGSTPVIGAVAGITQCAGSKALVIRPSYPLYDLPVELFGGVVHKEARFVTALDTDDNGQPFKTNGRWNIDYHSLKRALSRHHPSLVYLNFPSNPTGYSPTELESREIVQVLLEHIMECWAQGKRAPLILEDIAYATMMHGSKPFFGLHHAAVHLTQHATVEEKKLLQELKQSLVVVHSFSKAFSVAGDRVGYFATENEQLREEISNRMTVFDLTPGRGALAAMKGALKANDINKDSMNEYEVRLKHFEQGINHIVTSWGNVKKVSSVALSRLLPVQATADAGFFSLTFFNMLQGHKVSKVFIHNIESQISKLPPSSRAQFIGMFQQSRINTGLDAALWLMETAGVICVPIGDDSGRILLRFSVGQTPVATIDEALRRIERAISEVPAPQQSFFNITWNNRRQENVNTDCMQANDSAIRPPIA